MIANEAIRQLFRPSFKELKIAIVGAGVAGLTAARSLIQMGLENVTVYDRAANSTAVGNYAAGMVIATPGFDALRQTDPLLTNELMLRGGTAKLMGHRLGNLTHLYKGHYPDVCHNYKALIIPRNQYIQSLLKYPMQGSPLHRSITPPVEFEDPLDPISDRTSATSYGFPGKNGAVVIQPSVPTRNPEIFDSKPWERRSDWKYYPSSKSDYSIIGTPSVPVPYPDPESSPNFNPPASVVIPPSKRTFERPPPGTGPGPKLRQLKVIYGKQVVDFESGLRNPKLPRHINRIYFEDGEFEDFHLVVIADGRYSTLRLRLSGRHDNARTIMWQVKPDINFYRIEGYAPVSHVLASLPSHAWPPYNLDELWTLWNKGFRFNAAITRTCPTTPVGNFDLSATRPRASHTHPRKVAPTDYVYWRAYVPRQHWTKGGFPPRQLVGSIYPQNPMPHPQEIARSLFDDKGWVPFVKECVANSVPGLMTGGEVDHVPSFMGNETMADIGSFIIMGQAAHGHMPGSFINDTLDVEDGIRLGLSAYESRHPFPETVDTLLGIYDSNAIGRTFQTEEIAREAVHAHDPALGLPEPNFSTQMHFVAPWNHVKANYIALYDFDLLFPWQGMVDRVIGETDAKELGGYDPNKISPTGSSWSKY